MDPEAWMTALAHDASGHMVYDPTTGHLTVAHRCVECDVCGTPKNTVVTISDVEPCADCFRVGSAGTGYSWCKWLTPPDWTGGTYGLQQNNEFNVCEWNTYELLLNDTGQLGLYLSEADCIADDPWLVADVVGLWVYVYYGSSGLTYGRTVQAILVLYGVDADEDEHSPQVEMFEYTEISAKPFDCCDDAWGGANILVCGEEGGVTAGFNGTVTIDGECSSEE